jgi:hypothetical protein
MDTFEGKVYTINTSLNERTIYIKIIDTIQYLNYEGNIELKEFRMPITLQDNYLEDERFVLDVFYLKEA